MHLSTQKLDWIGLNVVWARTEIPEHRKDQRITSGSLGSRWIWVQIQSPQWHDLGKSSNIRCLSVPIYKLDMAITHILLFSSLLALLYKGFGITLPVAVTLYKVRQGKKEVEKVSSDDR